MANTINIDLSVDDNGSISKNTSRIRELNKELLQAQKLSTGTLSGANAAKRAGYMPGEGADYGVARSAVGTGAEGRDFAKQAQGLGGLVHVYATFAANLFAVGAAFRALSDAADTTNMVKGLDQLSVASGTALGSLSQELVKAAGGAISLREAMEATTKGSAAGLSTDQMRQMAEVARKASQALGISMPDAMSRLSKGIAKLTPELLDELGIYTRIDKATQDYARSIGKTVTSLTDYERRQAFANAVLKEGSDRFKDIKIESNPYEQILASIKNVAQSGLELVNKVLGPLVRYLAESPTALAASLALIGATLLKQAIPAITAMRANFRAAADESAAVAKKLADEAKQAADANLNQAKNLAREKASVEIAAAQTAIDQIKVKADEALKSRKGTLYNITQMDPKDIGQAEIAKLQAEQQKRATQGRAEEAKAIQAVIDQVGVAKRAKEEEAVAISKIAEQEAKQGSVFGIIRNQQMIAERAAAEAASRRLVSTALENVQTVGLASAYTILAASIKKAREEGEIGAVRAAWTQFSGTLAIVIQRLAIMANAFSTIGIIIGVAVEAFSLLNDWLSKNGEEVAKFKDAMTSLHAAGKLVSDVMDNIDKSGKGFITVDSILARANAFNELASSIDKGVTSLDAAKNKASGWDRFIDGFKSIFGASLTQTFSKEMAASISKGIEAIPEGIGKDELIGKLSTIFNTKNLTEAGIEKATDKISSSKIIGVFKEASKEITAFGLAGQEAAKPLKSLQDDMDTLDKAAQTLNQSLALSDPMSKFGSAMIRVGVDIGKAFEDPLNALAEIKKLMGDTSKLSLLPPNAITDLQRMSDQVKETDMLINSYRQSLVLAEQGLETLSKTNPNPRSQAAKELPAQKQAAQENIDNLKNLIKESISSLKNLSEEGSKLQVKAMQQGLDILTRGLVNAQATARIGVSQTLLSGVEGVAASQERTKLGQEELKIQEKNILATVNLTDQMLLSRISMDKLTTATDIARLEAKGKDRTALEDQQLANATKLAKDLETVGDLLGRKGSTGKEVDLTTLSPGAAQFMVARQEKILGAQTALAPIKGKEQQLAITGALDANKAAYAVEQKALKLDLDRLNAEKQRLDSIQQYLPYLTEEQLTSKQTLEDKIAQNQISSKLTTLSEQESDLRIRISKATGNNKTLLEGQLATTEANNQKVLDTLNAEDRIRQVKQQVATIENKITIEKLKREEGFAREDLNLRTASARTTAEKELLDVKVSLGIITDAEAEKQRNAIERTQVEQKLNEDLFKAKENFTTKIADIEAKIALAKAIDKNADVSALEEIKKNIKERYGLEIDLIEESNRGKMRAVELNQSISDKMKGFGGIVENSFKNMADALVEFVKTGKLNFGDLIATMLADLLKFELEYQASALYKGMGGLSGILGSLGFSTGSTPTPATPADTAFLTAAHGRAFDYGIEKFAMGGTFTNSIVNTPTLFKFAQGTGMMGEAGPEAIMPLKRDSQGNLGVRAGSHSSAPSTNVVVNNFSTEKATTSETTDARGNRRIEVTIGDLTAGEISRTGSNSQRSLQNTYGLQPQLIRR
jgi:lambda family phage tail tape measure protein